jgi:hypothetical protein
MTIDPMGSGGGDPLRGGPVSSGLSTDRMQEILRRLTSGYYDTAPVRTHVAQRIRDELSGAGSTA